MQYLLTEQEYKSLAPISKVNELKEKIQLLNDKVIELTEHPCCITLFYCDTSPIGAFGTKTCMKKQSYSK